MFSRNTFGLFIFVYIFVVFSNGGFQNSESLFKNIGIRKIVYPKVLTRKETISRFKRSIYENDHIDMGSLYIAVNRWIIKTNFNDDLLISPHYVTEWIHNSKNIKPMFDDDKKKLDKCLPLKGNVREVDNSSVLLTLCNRDIFGLINVSSKLYFLQPSDIDGRHIIYETTIPYKLTSIMDEYNLYSKNRTENRYYSDSMMNNKVNSNGKMKSKGKIKYRQRGNENYTDATIHKRDRREAGLFNKVYSYYKTERPYRNTQDCFERQRNKRALSICDTAEYYNMTGDLASPDYIQFIDGKSGIRFDFNYDDDADFSNRDYQSSQRMGNEQQYLDISSRLIPGFRPASRVTYRWIKMIVGVDYDVIQFHGRHTEHYVFTVFNIVSSLFKDISSTNIARIVIMKMVLCPDARDSPIYTGDLKYPLYSVNKWNREVWHNSTEKYDMAVWYTHYQVNEDINTSPGPFMCQYQWSCLLVEDVGWLSAIRIAHGIGHLLGLTHDGDLAVNNNCALDSLLETTIMSEVIPAIMPNPIWSACSKSEYEFAIKKYPCLDKPPLTYEHTEFLYGVFSLDDQCRIEFGDGWIYCSRISVPDPCKELWCNKNVGKRRSCMTRQTRTLEGTLCSRGKRCINQTCEDATRPGYVEGTTSQPPHYPGFPEFSTTTLLSPLSPTHPMTATIIPPSYPGYLQTTTVESSSYPSYPVPTTYRPSFHPTYPGTTTYRPPEYPGYSEILTHRPSSYPDFTGTITTHRPTAGYPIYSETIETTTYRPLSYPSYPETTTYRPPGYPTYPDTTTYRPSGYPNYPETTYRPSGYPTYPNTTTFRPGGYPSYPEVTTYRPPGYPIYPETTTHLSSGYPTYSETTTYRPAGYPTHPNTTTFRPGGYPSYSEITTYRPPGYPTYPETTTHLSSGYPSYLETTTYRPAGYPTYPDTTTYRPAKYSTPPEPSTHRPSNYPDSADTSTSHRPTAGYPIYPETITYRPSGYPSYPETSETTTDRPSSYPSYSDSSTYRPSSYPTYPDTTTFRPEGYSSHPELTTYRPSGYPNYPETTAPVSSGYPNYVETTTYRPPGYPTYPDTTTYRPSGYPNYPETTYRPSGYPAYPGTTTYRPPNYPNYSGTSTHRPSTYTSFADSTTTYNPTTDYSIYSETIKTTTYGPSGRPTYPGTTTYRPNSHSSYPAPSTHRPAIFSNSNNTHRPTVSSYPSYPETTETTSYGPSGYPTYPSNTIHSPSGYPNYPSYPEITTFRPSSHPNYSEITNNTTQRPSFHQLYPETATITYRPPGYPSYSGTTTYTPSGNPSYTESITHRPAGYPSYPETTTHRRFGRSKTSTHTSPGYLENSTYRPSGFPGTSTYEPPGYPESNLYGELSYPETTSNGRPNYPRTVTHGPPAYPGIGTNGLPGYMRIDTNEHPVENSAPSLSDILANDYRQIISPHYNYNSLKNPYRIN